VPGGSHQTPRQYDGQIIVGSETTLTGIPPEAWEYGLGNRSALEWILDQ
jgi:predicted helicase